MEVGDYVRYKYENVIYIGKINFISEIMYGLDETLEISIDNSMEAILKKDIIKSSPNIIDLIEVGDYVNGYLVTDVYKPDGNEVFRIEIERDTLKGHIIDKSSHIKSIVTKEQFESMEYKIGE